MAKIIGKPDEWPHAARKPLRYAGPNWFLSSVAAWSEVFQTGGRLHQLDLSQVDFVTLYEWVSTVAMIERVMSHPSTSYVDFDLIGGPELPLMSPQDFISADKAGGNETKTASFVQAKRVYSIAGFLESLGTLEVLNAASRGSRANYPWVGEERARLRAIHSRRENEDTIVMPLCRISSKDDCRQFLDEQRIMSWRETMNERFRESPLFEYEELWRVFCHELAVNIFEHAKTAGFLAGRVVLPHTAAGRIRPWCEMTYRPEIAELFADRKSGFLELCVSDAGRGFLESLGATFRKKAGLGENTLIRDEDLLAFAFDEVGTCKLDHECWATARHALGRILQIVAKYGGALTLRSGRAELLYVSRGGPFERIPGRMGYKPQHGRSLSSPIPGAHIQLILPLVPFQRAEKRNSILVSTLPDGFHHDPSHVHGHLVPLLERLGTGRAAVDDEERSEFRGKCEVLARELIASRPANEVLVLDFSNLQWPAAQFETLLYLLQNVLQQRLVLLVEIAPDLARDVVEMERDAAATFLDESLLKTKSSESSGHFSELSEQRFLETYRCVHATVLGIDTNSNEYIFGLPDRGVEKLLLGLIDKPMTFEELCRQPNVNQRALRAILHNMNPLFQIGDKQRWRTVWDRQALMTETRRAMSRWFDEVALRCKAWRGGQPRNPGKMKFNLPWQDEWVSCFFEAARILSRQRHADEAAQRLIFRLETGLHASGKTLSEVRVLACVTAPAILLATALHRWWPTAERPAVADLGPYLLLHDDGLPMIAGSGGIVVVQDVLDRKVISSRLVERLNDQKKEVLCILSLVQLVEANDPVHPIGATNIDDWDTEPVRTHAMISLERPPRCTPATEEDSEAYWVEPRTLRPFNYDLLRRKRKARNVPKELERPDYFSPKQEGVLCAGHYVYGERHYTIALDIKRALDGVIGNEVSAWLATMCIGSPDNLAEWASPRSSEFSGAVTAVLMPLHSQIHYLWPTVENLLAQRGRRQPMWLLDATLFLGHGAAYRLPLQFQDQVDQAMLALLRERSANSRDSERGMRLLIVDDAMVRARTAETILAEIDRAVRKARENARKEFGDRVEEVDPIEWIRHFAIFDQMGNARRQHWRNLTRIGHGRGIPFLFEEYKWISGVPDYEESNCPACAEIERLQKLAAAAMHAQADVARSWAEKRREALLPVAIDAPGFQRPALAKLPRPIDLLARSEPVKDNDKLRVFNADEAILRFFELTYMSYPPTDILRSLKAPNAWALDSDPPDVIAAYERFRWGVLGWCLQKWPRLVADSARKAFIEAANAELESATPIAECLFEGMARHRHDDLIKEFIVSTLRRLAAMEKTRLKPSGGNEQRNMKLRVLLSDVLTLFLLGIPPEELRNFEVTVDEKLTRLLDFIGQMASSIFLGELSFVGNLQMQFTRPQHFAEPSWALNCIAETLFRGRAQNDPAGSHRLLPRLLCDVNARVDTEETWRLLQANLSSFLAALDNLAHFSTERALPIERVKAEGDTVLDWLRGRPFSRDADRPWELVQLIDELSLEEDFCHQFNQIFHQTVEELRGTIEERATKYQDRLQFEFVPQKDVKDWHVLAEVASITEPLTNWAIDAAENLTGLHKSRIEVRINKSASGKNWIRFRILCNFDSLDAINACVIGGRNYDREARKLKLYGALLPNQWQSPSIFEIAEEFTAVYEFDMPAGAIPRNRP
jgi:hypothetical protein